MVRESVWVQKTTTVTRNNKREEERKAEKEIEQGRNTEREKGQIDKQDKQRD